MIKVRINSTGEVVDVRPYRTETYDFMVCRNGGIMGELYMRSELTIIGDKELEVVELVKRMRETQRNYYKDRPKVGYKVAYQNMINKEQLVDEYLKKMEG